MIRTLIIGATGHLGQELVKACTAQGQEVHALVRASTQHDATKMKPLRAVNATVHVGDVKDHSSLLAACKAVDAVICALGGAQLADEGAVVEAVKAAGVKRFVPSDFGLDPAAAGPGVCVLFDAKAAVQKAVKDRGIPYTLIHSNCFFSYWVYSLGDLSKLGGTLPPREVNVYGDGTVKGSFASVPDIAAITARAVNDPKMRNQEIRIVANTVSQNELIDRWQKQSRKTVKQVPVPAEQLDRIIASATGPDQMMTLIVTQLHRSVWIRGDAMKKAGVAIDVQQAYPDIKLQTIDQAFSQLP